jgi:hypothetical protein
LQIIFKEPPYSSYAPEGPKKSATPQERRAEPVDIRPFDTSRVVYRLAVKSPFAPLAKHLPFFLPFKKQVAYHATLPFWRRTGVAE